jgi:hypothetical protein
LSFVLGSLVNPGSTTRTKPTTMDENEKENEEDN